MKPIASLGRRAAQMYLTGLADKVSDGPIISMRVCAERYGITLGAVARAVKLLREELRAAEEEATP